MTGFETKDRCEHELSRARGQTQSPLSCDFQGIRDFMIQIKAASPGESYVRLMPISSSTLLQRDSSGSVTLAEATQFSASGIVSRAVLSCDGLRVTLFGFAAGQELTEHTSSSRALIQILSGSSTWTIAGREQVAGAGELLHLPPHTPHAVRAEEPFSMLLTLIREPAPRPLANLA